MKKIKGFTLIELLVVISILGVLTALLLPNLVGSRQRARDARRKHDLVEIKNALRLYYNDEQTYPEDSVFTFGSSWGEYMSSVPNDPLDGVNYHYCVSDDGNSFILAAELENLGDPGIDESITQCNPSTYHSLLSCSLSDCQDDDSEFVECYYVCGD